MNPFDNISDVETLLDVVIWTASCFKRFRNRMFILEEDGSIEITTTFDSDYCIRIYDHKYTGITCLARDRLNRMWFQKIDDDDEKKISTDTKKKIYNIFKKMDIDGFKF